MQIELFPPYQLLWLFFIYAFLGWCAEVAYAALETGRLVNRGFLNGPVCPIYGFGMALVLALLLPIQENIWGLFLGSVVLTTLIELVGGWALETLFHTTWWDYSDQPFNFRGYICLRFSIGWGVGASILVRVVHPLIMGLLDWLPMLPGWVLLAVLSALFAADLAATVQAVTGLERRMEELDRVAAALRQTSDRLTRRVGTRALEVDQKLDESREELEARRLALQVEVEDQLTEAWEELQERQAALQARFDLLQAELLDARLFAGREARRLMLAFPKMRSLRHTGRLAELREKLDRRR